MSDVPPQRRPRTPLRCLNVESDYLRAVWREVSRHLEIEESVATLHGVLAAALGTRFLLVRRWDAEHGTLRTVGAAGLPAPASRTTLAGPTAGVLTAWAAARTAQAWHDRGADRVGRAVVPEGLSGPIVVAPLFDESSLLSGVLVLGGVAEIPPEMDDLVEAMAVALRNDARLAELARVREAAEADRVALLSRLGRQELTEGLVGAEGGLREVMARVGQVAATDVPVLLLGETGSGKEVVARLVHERSRRHRGPFLRVNCGAIPSELVDSELFGHERGAFTGALATRKGWFERADGGTLFLDEVGELPAAAQVRLLRVLQDGSFQRVGAQDSRTADVRIVAATHRDLPVLVGRGDFRQDLWYRISVFPVRIPPLRERVSDIPLLVEHFAASAGNRLFGMPLIPSGADLALLSTYPWPGNVRELAAVIERAAILGDGRGLMVAKALGVHDGPASASPEGRQTPEPARLSDTDQIHTALRACLGRIEGPFGAARKLGINPHTLRAKMRRLGIDWGAYRSA